MAFVSSIQVFASCLQLFVYYLLDSCSCLSQSTIPLFVRRFGCYSSTIASCYVAQSCTNFCQFLPSLFIVKSAQCFTTMVHVLVSPLYCNVVSDLFSYLLTHLLMSSTLLFIHPFVVSRRLVFSAYITAPFVVCLDNVCFC